MLRATIDHVTIPNLNEYYTESPEFILEVPSSSKELRKYFKPPVRSGKGKAVAAGYWIMTKPLLLGRHVIQFEGRHRDGFKTTGKYNIKVVERNPPFRK